MKGRTTWQRAEATQDVVVGVLAEAHANGMVQAEEWGTVVRADSRQRRDSPILASPATGQRCVYE